MLLGPSFIVPPAQASQARALDFVTELEECMVRLHEIATAPIDQPYLLQLAAKAKGALDDYFGLRNPHSQRVVHIVMAEEGEGRRSFPARVAQTLLRLLRGIARASIGKAAVPTGLAGRRATDGCPAARVLGLGPSRSPGRRAEDLALHGLPTLPQRHLDGAAVPQRRASDQPAAGQPGVPAPGRSRLH